MKQSHALLLACASVILWIYFAVLILRTL
jgi:hypothetical protein